MKDVLDGLKHIGIAALAFGIVLVLGLLETWVIIPVTPLIGAVGGYIAVNGDKKTKLAAAKRFGLIGLAAGVGFYLAI